MEKEVEQHVLQMTPSAASSTKATNPIINLSGNRRSSLMKPTWKPISDLGQEYENALTSFFFQPV